MDIQLQNIKAFIIDKINKNEDIYKYTDLQWFYRIEQNQTLLLEQNQGDIKNTDEVVLASLIIKIIYLDEKHSFFDFKEEDIDKNVEQLKLNFTIDEQIVSKAGEIAKEAFLNNDLKSKESQIVNDAFLMDILCPVNGENRIMNVYEQLVAKNFTDTKTQWNDSMLSHLNNKNLLTPYAIEKFSKHKKKLTKNLKKNQKEISRQNDLILEKELDISEVELKELKKQLSKIKGRDDRGIQTLLRTTSKNHYTLKQLVDNKAQIMITVNSIILSFIIGKIIGTTNTTSIYGQLPFAMFAIINVFSILFAVLAITPIKTQGKFTEEEIRNKQGNLLYFGNFHQMKYPDFEWGFLQLLNDKDYLYLSMIRDFYYQGIGIQKKFTYIRFSLFIFLIGIIITSLIYLITTLNECI